MYLVFCFFFLVHHNLKQSQSLKGNQRSKGERLGQIQKIHSCNCGFDFDACSDFRSSGILKEVIKLKGGDWG